MDIITTSIILFYFAITDINLNRFTDYSLVTNQVALTTACNSNTPSQTKHDQQGISSVLTLHSCNAYIITTTTPILLVLH